MTKKLNFIHDFKSFKKLNESMSDLDNWKELMDKYDLKFYNEFLHMSDSDLEQIREDYNVIRRYALNKLNDELRSQGKTGQLLNMDVSDDELYPYLDNSKKFTFFKYSRILDFKDGYKPKNIHIIDKKFLY